VGLEIERKFLLVEAPSWLRNRSAVSIEQGYLAVAEGVEVRLRREGARRHLTVKLGAGEIREEVELEVDPAHFEALWPLTESRRLTKKRYRAALGDGLEAEVDVYDPPLEGLLIAEIEFPSEQRSREFSPPAWLGKEVTGDPAYANRNLAFDGATKKRTAAGQGKGSFRSYGLRRGEGAGEGLRRIARGRAEKALEELAEARDSGLADAIHAARKDLKKLRAVLRLSRDQLGRKLFRAENGCYRDAGRLLSRSRDAEVKLETLAALRRRFGSAFPKDEAAEWIRALERERDELIGDAENRRAPIQQAIEAIEAGRDRIGEWPLEQDSWGLLGPGLIRSYRQGRRALRRTLADPAAENVHEWRKRAKDLWYQLRIVREAWPELLGSTVETAHELSDRLGDHHDLAVLSDDLGGRGIERRGDFERLVARRQEELLDEALEIGRRLYAEKPNAFGRRIGSYWETWRASRSTSQG
jgi:CYTH domain-containing protein/CHAD domain-containing protein